jgi:hypothetical protein
MPSRPPETEFYKDDLNHELWRDVSRLYEDRVGPNGERKQDFKTVLTDITARLDETPERKVIR